MKMWANQILLFQMKPMMLIWGLLLLAWKILRLYQILNRWLFHVNDGFGLDPNHWRNSFGIPLRGDATTWFNTQVLILIASSCTNHFIDSYEIMRSSFRQPAINSVWHKVLCPPKFLMRNQLRNLRELWPTLLLRSLAVKVLC